MPIELPCPLLQPEQLTLLQRAANPVLKRATAFLAKRSIWHLRLEARAAVGLPTDVGDDMPPCGPIPARVEAQCHIVSGSTHLVGGPRQQPGGRRAAELAACLMPPASPYLCPLT